MTLRLVSCNKNPCFGSGPEALELACKYFSGDILADAGYLAGCSFVNNSFPTARSKSLKAKEKFVLPEMKHGSLEVNLLKTFAEIKTCCNVKTNSQLHKALMTKTSLNNFKFAYAK